MIITIDTTKDSPEDINRAIEILKQYTSIKEKLDWPKKDTNLKIQENLEQETKENKEQSAFKSNLLSEQSEIKHTILMEKPNITQGVQNSSNYQNSYKKPVDTAPDFSAYLNLVKQKEEVKSHQKSDNTNS